MAWKHDAVLHDLIAVRKPRWMYAILAAVQHGVAGDVAGENHAGENAVVLQVDLQCLALPARCRIDLQGKANPSGFGFRQCGGDDELVAVALEEPVVALEPFVSQGPQFFYAVHLADAKRRSRLVGNEPVGEIFKNK